MFYKLLTIAFFLWMALLALGALTLLAAMWLDMRNRQRLRERFSPDPIRPLKKH